MKPTAISRPFRYKSDYIGNELLMTWQEAEHNRWAFTHMTEVTTNAVISNRTNPDTPTIDLEPVLQFIPSLVQRLEDTYTDALVIMRQGEILGEYYAAGSSSDTQHLLMSVSKSLCGILAGILQDRAQLDPCRQVTDYIPELKSTAYDGHTVQQVLDMQIPINYSEDYVDSSSEVQRHDRSSRWRPQLEDDASSTCAFLTTLQGIPHPGTEKFQYCSANTDVLAWIIERTTGQRYVDVLSKLLWSKLDAEHPATITVDQEGFGYANGGISCTARDLALVGQMMLRGGSAAGGRVVSEKWVKKVFSGGNPAAMEHYEFAQQFPGASYTDQWWCTGDKRGIISGIGIHGQNLWIDPSQDLVIVKLSSWPEPDTEQWHGAQNSLLLDLTKAVNLMTVRES